MPIKLLTSGGGGVNLTPSASIASDQTVYVPVSGTSGGTLVCSDSSGNVGIGVTPSAWGSYRALQVGATSAIYTSSGTGYYTILSNNVFKDSGGTSKYIVSSYATEATQESNGSFIWRTAASGTAGNAITFTQAMTLNSSGNLGIGTASPGEKLTIDNGASGNEFVRFDKSASFQGLIGVTQNAGQGSGSSVAGDMIVRSQTRVLFDTAGTTRALIDSSGNLLVGTTSQGGNGCVLTLSANSGTTKWDTGPRNAVATNFYVAASTSTGVYITSSATSWSSNSDERLKTELTPFENATEKICSLRAGTGRYLTDDEGISRSFLIAQDVQAVLPEAVNIQDDEQGTLGLQYTDVIPLLVAAIKELTAKVAALEGGK